MKYDNIIIRGRIPSKKNSRINCVRNGRIRSFPSKQYKAWHKDASAQLPRDLSVGVCSIIIEFYFPDARAADMTNKAESIMDLLVDNGILIDDNYMVVYQLILKAGGVDRANPRAEVYICQD